MKTHIAIALIALAGITHAAHAADAAKEPTKQQSKMGMCNKEAGDKKGDERKAFMKECLSTKKEAKADAKTDAKVAEAKADGKSAQQEKMKACNVEAKGKKGDERKAFMKECLSK
ncbi:MAG TPA: PsiF family protein [Burkholderiaceae bacterium]|nr:PsiF family protein [Burkholderiaceae bacterium]